MRVRCTETGRLHAHTNAAAIRALFSASVKLCTRMTCTQPSVLGQRNSEQSWLLGHKAKMIICGCVNHRTCSKIYQRPLPAGPISQTHCREDGLCSASSLFGVSGRCNLGYPQQASSARVRNKLPSSWGFVRGERIRSGTRASRMGH